MIDRPAPSEWRLETAGASYVIRRIDPQGAVQTLMWSQVSCVDQVVAHFWTEDIATAACAIANAKLWNPDAWTLIRNAHVREVCYARSILELNEKYSD